MMQYRDGRPSVPISTRAVSEPLPAPMMQYRDGRPNDPINRPVVGEIYTPPGVTLLPRPGGYSDRRAKLENVTPVPRPQPFQPQPAMPQFGQVQQQPQFGQQPQFNQQGMQQMMQMQQMAATNPQVAQQLQALTNQIEARKSVLIAEMTEEFMKEEKKITSQFDHDPLLKLKSREVDLRAMENERKKQEMEKKMQIDQAKLVQNRELTDDKLEQNEELAELRADTSIEKQEMANENRLTLANMKPSSITKQKG